ncbi:Protein STRICTOSIDINE SYNTHASE-LIKE 7 [Hondaea fermentalgiana]|uniref:Protein STRICTOSIDINE SYNTHASE-LIKE 7 n=1 Tax=Hondaea fermentalgiana TaxID=2315210 RepID=A0A2R5GMJ0_9STRA|nr:Protein STRICTOSIDINE SYNTHASE-LIKE 7 [Hondaea fermentalgiana]|eukprot:GBG32096.1 Protein STRICTOSIDINE SYNTHASE-LIKE 7 [Hondaea fermentalgiana]
MEIVRDGDQSGEGLVLSGGCLADGNAIWAVSAARGKVVRFADAEALDGRPTEAVATRGSPSGVAVDADGRVYASDLEHGAILKIDVENAKYTAIVQDYEGQPLLGPSSLAFGADGTMYFTDSGPLGESSLDNACGSVFAITRDESGQVLRPLALGCLAHPCGICVSPRDDNIVYVAETLRNRVLRFSRRPHGAFLCSVLHQFSGRIGPSAIAVDPNTGYLYVARYEFDTNTGLISVIDPSGVDQGIVRDIEIPELAGGEISALSLNPDAGELLIFEATSAKLVKLRI